MGVNHQHWLSSSQQSTPTVIFHLRLRNRSLQTMSTLFRTLSVVLLISISYKPSLVLCASAAKNEFAGATHDYLGVSSTTAAAGTEDTPNSYHELKYKGKILMISYMKWFWVIFRDRNHLKFNACKLQTNSLEIIITMTKAWDLKCRVMKILC